MEEALDVTAGDSPIEIEPQSSSSGDTLVRAVQTTSTPALISVGNDLKLNRKTQLPVSLPVVLGVSAALRIAVFVSTALPEVLEGRPELATPITSLRSLKEGVYIWRHGGNPYDGGVFYHSPIYLALFNLLSPTSRPLMALLWTLADTAAACALVAIAKSRRVPSSQYSLVAAIYLLNPYTLLSCLARSTTSLDNALVLLSIAALVQDAGYQSLGLLAAASHTSLYPILLLPAFIMTLTSRCSSGKLGASAHYIAMFSALFAVGVVVAYIGLGDWSWAVNSWGTILTASDLTPNVGVWWYFFTEMFDHFRNFFVGVFQLHVLIYVAPICIRLSHDPLLAILVLLGVIGTFKSYPSLGDTAIWTGLLACFPEVVTNLRHPLVTVTTHLYTLLLLPLLHSLWLLTGTGNANFFYAATLVFAVANGMGVIDILGAGLKAQVKAEAREKLGIDDSEEEWEKRGLVAVQYATVA